MDLIEQVIRRILVFVGVDSQQAIKVGSTITHSLIIYILLTGSGIALFAPSFWLMPIVIPIAVVLLIGSLLGIAEWSEMKISRTAKGNIIEKLISTLTSFLSFYLTIVGVGISVLIEFGIISNISWELLSIFIFAAAFLVYSLYDLPQLFEKNG